MTLIFDKTLKEIREEKGLTQSKLADMLGITLRTVQKYEEGKTIPPAMVKLIKYELRDVRENSSQNNYRDPKDMEIDFLRKIRTLNEEKINYLEDRLNECLNSLSRKGASQ